MALITAHLDAGVILVNCKERKKTCSSSVVPELWPYLSKNSQKSSQTSDRCWQELNLLCCWQLVPIFPKYRAPVAGQPEAAPFGPCCSCTLCWTRDAFLKFSQSYDMVGLTAGLLVDLGWTFWTWVNLIQKWQGSSSSLGEIYRYVLVRFMSLCKSVCFIRGRGERPRVSVCVERATDGQCDATCVCLSECFCGLDPMTVPQLSRNKFRAPLCYRGSVLGLNVSCFFHSLGASKGTRAEQTQSTNGSRWHNYVTKKCGQCWPILDTRLFLCLHVFVFVF